MHSTRFRRWYRTAPRAQFGDSSILYLDHFHENGVALFEKCLELDLEGIVAKPEASPYRELKGKTTWVKVLQEAD
jgi:ATP-dependent DNA ligase